MLCLGCRVRAIDHVLLRVHPKQLPLTLVVGAKAQIGPSVEGIRLRGRMHAADVGLTFVTVVVENVVDSVVTVVLTTVVGLAVLVELRAYVALGCHVLQDRNRCYMRQAKRLQIGDARSVPTQDQAGTSRTRPVAPLSATLTGQPHVRFAQGSPRGVRRPDRPRSGCPIETACR